MLTFLCLIILVAVIAEITVTSTTDLAIARTELQHMRYEYAARGGLELARAILLKDDDDDRGDAEAGPIATLLATEGTAFAAPFAEAIASTESSLSLPDSAMRRRSKSRVDSLADVWARSSQSLHHFGEVAVRIDIVDEDRKLNLLSLVASDEEQRDQARAQVRRLLDLFREGTPLDLSDGEARAITDGLTSWFRGERGGHPIPLQSSGPGKKGLMRWSQSGFVDEPDRIIYPFTMSELVGVPGLSEEILNSTEIDGDRVPGLVDVATVFTSLVYDPDRALRQRETFVWPFQQRQKGYQETVKRQAAARERALREALASGADGRVNANTAPSVVLEALLPTSIRSRNYFGDWVRVRPRAAAETWPSESRAPLDTEISALRQLERGSHRPIEVAATDRAAFDRAVTVRSNVFSIHIHVGGSSAKRDDDWFPRESYQSVVWRRVSGDDSRPTLVTVSPLMRVERRAW